jgi:hypothetical protein
MKQDMNEKSKIVSLLQQRARFAFVSVQAVVLKSVLFKFYASQLM